MTTDPGIEAAARALAAYEKDEVAFQEPRRDGVTRSGNSEDYYRQRAAVVLDAVRVDTTPEPPTEDGGQ